MDDINNKQTNKPNEKKEKKKKDADGQKCGAILQHLENTRLQDLFFSFPLFYFIISLQPSNGSRGGEGGAPPAQWSNIRQQSEGSAGGRRQRRPGSSSLSQHKDCWEFAIITAPVEKKKQTKNKQKKTDPGPFLV